MMASDPIALFDAKVHPEGLGEQDLESMRLFGMTAAVVAAHDFPDAWQAFRFRPAGAPGAAEIAVMLDPRRFPSYLRGRTLKISDLTLFLKVAPDLADAEEVHISGEPEASTPLPRSS